MSYLLVAFKLMLSYTSTYTACVKVLQPMVTQCSLQILGTSALLRIALF